MITNINLTESGIEAWNSFFNEHAKDGVRIDATTLEMLNTIQDNLVIGDAMIYELGARYTNSGRPELFMLEDNMVEIEDRDDDE
jgi:hypothetical protein